MKSLLTFYKWASESLPAAVRPAEVLQVCVVILKIKKNKKKQIKIYKKRNKKEINPPETTSR